MRALALAALLVATGCATTAPASEYAGTVWTLDRIVTADGAVRRGSGEERLTFGADGALSVASCNQCNGRYEIDGPTLIVDEALGCTRRGCPDGAIELERYTTGALSMRREGTFLIIEAAGVGGVSAQLLFTPEAPVAAPPAP